MKVGLKQPSERGSKRRTGNKGCAGGKACPLPPLPSSMSISLSFSSLATAREHSLECYSVALGSSGAGRVCQEEFGKTYVSI